MAHYEQVPVDLNKIKSKAAFNLTGRQIVCFLAAGAVGFPFYFLTRDLVGSDISVLLMVVIMMPFFFLAIYEKNGFPAEVLFCQWIRYRYLRPGNRPFQSENVYLEAQELHAMREEVKYLEAKKRGRLEPAGTSPVKKIKVPTGKSAKRAKTT